MFDNLKIGKKMLLLSGTILCLLLVVLTVGIYGLFNTINSGQKVAEGELLKANLAELEIAHQNWAGQIATFLNDDSVNELNIQTDPHKCSFGQWYYGEGRQKAEQMLPGLHENLLAIEKPHAALHASAKAIQAAYRSADPYLPQFLTEKELDHMGWAYKIQQAIIARDNGVNVEFDHTKCSLGQFLYGEEGRRAVEMVPELGAIFAAIKGPHEQLHSQGERLSNILKAGNYTQAAGYFAAEVTPTLEEVGELLQKAKQNAVAALKGQQEAELIFSTETQQNLQGVQKELSAMREKVSGHADTLIYENNSSVKTQTVTVISFGVIALILGSLISVLISRSLTGPMRKTVDMLEELEKGHIDKRLQLNRKDEIGQMAESMDRFADSLQNEVVDSLQKLADGNLTFQVTPRDSQDLLRGSLEKLGNDLNSVMAQILVAGEEIASASGQVADSSQVLSQGATESAASLEEISASLNQTSSQATQNAENATQANSISIDTKQAAEKGSTQMKQMVSAMAEINEAGQNISKIIKTIDEIAFQTNLLALNAAVEAARAGQHGKGFAVVAEEVRNLAARSAKAAAETAELIEGSVVKTASGSAIAEQTAAALVEIVTGVGKASDLVAEIAAASHEQAQGVAEINQGISQIDTVTQQNTASAEESAATAEEMSGQAAQLRHMLQRFTLKEKHHHVSNNVAPSQHVAPSRPTEVKKSATGGSIGWGGATPIAAKTEIYLDDQEFGKF
ncbi:methyl-accepting chemotaxis protein [uncultured Desulfuromusa sp.]|uniref:methyl-accepting chemotaxis protein n=1 Tax=uncultured Desulfuromusa sp. TaxID=219183 RepID=UPI002AA9245D|nr:methyl-accepting chemotaxis protein [uncultured Desulfuromusa sp.]